MPMHRLTRLGITILLGWLLGTGIFTTSHAAVNAALGGVGGINNGTLLGGDGTGDARVTLNVTDLALVKQARDLAGTLLPDNATVVPGQEVYFVLLVDNVSDAEAEEIRITDQLNESEFTYVAGSLETVEILNSLDFWTGPWAPLPDDISGAAGDIASTLDSGGPPGRDRITIGDVPGQANQPLEIPSGTIRAVRFRVTVN
ncbi:MAG: hypothetical protein C0624_04390 [Desulfuromonas sp.]|nr:MAG: hypothetical protein C0624_04390 [Desulfuromonas sp.]